MKFFNTSVEILSAILSNQICYQYDMIQVVMAILMIWLDKVHS